MNSRPFIKYLLLFLIVGGFALPLRGQTLPFLRIEVDSRAAAMGGTQLASSGHAMSVFTNSAGLDHSRGRSGCALAGYYDSLSYPHHGIRLVPEAGGHRGPPCGDRIRAASTVLPAEWLPNGK